MGSRPQVDFHQVFDSLPTPHVLLDADFAIVEMNQAYLDVTHRDRAELVGRNMFDAFPESGDNRQLLHDSLCRARAGSTDVLALIPYAIPIDAGTELRFWSATHVPLRDQAGQVAFILQQTQDVTELHQLRGAAGLAGEPDPRTAVLGSDVLRRAEEVQATNRTLLAQSQHLRRLFMEAPGFIAVLRGPDLIFELVNNAYMRVIGHRDVVGKPLREALPELDGQGLVASLQQVMASGEPYLGREVPALLQRTPGGAHEERFFDLVYQPIVEADGTISGIFVEGADITEQVLARRRQRVLIDELNHRVKNTLATVQAMAAQTLRPGVPFELFAEKFQARLLSLAHTHNLLARAKWEGALLAQLVRQELDPFAPERASFEGREIVLAPRTALALGLVLHELAANAQRFGALAGAAGQVAVTWKVGATDDPAGRLVLTWRETGAAGGAPSTAAAPPPQRGFGSRLIERSVKGELGGRLEVDFAPDGLLVVIDLPMQRGGA